MQNTSIHTIPSNLTSTLIKFKSNICTFIYKISITLRIPQNVVQNTFFFFTLLLSQNLNNSIRAIPTTFIVSLSQYFIHSEKGERVFLCMFFFYFILFFYLFILILVDKSYNTHKALECGCNTFLRNLFFCCVFCCVYIDQINFKMVYFPEQKSGVMVCGSGIHITLCCVI